MRSERGRKSKNILFKPRDRMKLCTRNVAVLNNDHHDQIDSEVDKRCYYRNHRMSCHNSTPVRDHLKHHHHPYEVEQYFDSYWAVAWAWLECSHISVCAVRPRLAHSYVHNEDIECNLDWRRPVEVVNQPSCLLKENRKHDLSLSIRFVLPTSFLVFCCLLSITNRFDEIFMLLSPVGFRWLFKDQHVSSRLLEKDCRSSLPEVSRARCGLCLLFPCGRMLPLPCLPTSA